MQANQGDKPPASHETHIPKVSIGMPVYNGEKLIREALDSLLAQTFTDFEVLISDNASTDGTEAICREYMRNDARIHYVKQATNIGASNNFRYLVEHARGEYFKWLAYDDLIEPSFLEVMIDYLDAHGDVVLCASDVALIDGRRADQIVTTRRLEAIRDTVEWESARRMIVLPYRLFTHFCNFAFYGVYRLNSLLSVSSYIRPWLWGMDSSGEYMPLVQTALQGRIVSLPFVLFKFRINEHSICRVEAKRFSELQRLLNDLYLTHNMLRAILCSKLAIACKMRILLRGVFVDAPCTATSYASVSITTMLKTIVDGIGGHGSARRVRYAVLRWLDRSKA